MMLKFKRWFGFALAIVAVLVIFFLFKYSIALAPRLSSYFEKFDAHNDDVVLFFADDCSYCAKVDDFLKVNKVDEKMDFIELNIADTANVNILSDKAQTCSIDQKLIGVPFLWNGPEKKCVIGYPDVINFFRESIQPAKK